MKIMNPRAESTIQQTHPPTATQDEQAKSQLPPAPVLSQKTPQEFYAEITKRPNVREVLEELATG
jgi:hypothetical protein